MGRRKTNAVQYSITLAGLLTMAIILVNELGGRIEAVNQVLEKLEDKVSQLCASRAHSNATEENERRIQLVENQLRIGMLKDIP